MSDIRNPLALAGRRALVGGAAAALALSLAAVPTASAQESTFDDATLTWGVNGYAQEGVFSAWRFFDAQGDAEILEGSTDGGAGTQTEYTPAEFPATSMPSDATPNAAKFTGGDGTRSADGVVTVDWDGEFTVNAYAEALGAPDETFRDPSLTINPDGSGTLVFDLHFAEAVDQSGDPTPAVDLPDTELLTFSPGAVDVAEDGTITMNADFDNVEYNPTDAVGTTEQARNCTTPQVWGAFPPEFIDALHYSVRAHYYTTSCGLQQSSKGPLPVQLSNVPAPVADDDDNDDNGGDGQDSGLFGSLGNLFGSLG